nr:class I SAM-dependent methyltransferase [uncultured Draconibacterium sp.]
MENREYYEDPRNEMEYFLTSAPKRSIEFGCSNGIFSERVKKKYKTETWGIDIDKESTDIAKTKMDKVFCGDALEIIEELPENYFDCLICNDFIEHVPSDRDFFKKIKKCLTDDAVLICSLPNIRHWKHFVRYFFLKDWKYKSHGILDYTHLRFYTKKSMKRAIKEWGFETELIKGIRPTKSPFFYLFCLITLNFIGDMRYLQYAFRAKLKEKI